MIRNRQKKLATVGLIGLLLIGLWLSILEIRSPRNISGDLIITEFLATNRTGITDADGDYSDWIEIYNAGYRPIQLADWALTNDPNHPQKWIFPHQRLAPGDHLLIFASGKNRLDAALDDVLHTNFKLDRQSGFLALYNRRVGHFSQDIQTVSSHYPPQQHDLSFGLTPDPSTLTYNTATYQYLGQPTPGKKNLSDQAWVGLMSPVNVSHTRGFYTQPIQISLSTKITTTTIRYTLDGREPSTSVGDIYTAPLQIDSTTTLRAIAIAPDRLPISSVAHTYIFLDDVLAQRQRPAGFPTSWGHIAGEKTKADYEMDPVVVEDKAAEVKASLTAIPTLAIATDVRHFFDLYTNPQHRGRAWERPVSVEYFDPSGKQADFQINAGWRIQGKLGREAGMPKRSFRLFFRSEYGAAKLHYPLFPESPVTEFETLVLRGGVNKSFAGYYDSDYEWTTYIRDEWSRASQIAMSGAGSHGTFVHLYINGLYWGLYNVIERPDADFLSAYYGGDATDWEWLSHAETVSPTIQTVSERFQTLHQLSTQGQLDQPEKYEAIQAYLDIDQFIDALILYWYSGNSDWGLNNWYAGIQKPDGPVKYFVWDNERTWFYGTEILMDDDEDGYDGQPELMAPLFKSLFKNSDFQIRVADRIYKHLFHDGALTEENAKARWHQLASKVEGAITAESARWGDTRVKNPFGHEDWLASNQDVLNQMEGNVDLFIQLSREDNYYPPLDPPRLSQQGGSITPGKPLTITLSATPTSTIYYTLDGSDPRLAITGQVDPNTKAYDHPIVLTQSTVIKTRVFVTDATDQIGGGWSALNQVRFHRGPEKKQLIISQIMYNPKGSDDYEFIALKNTGNVPFKLALAFFSGIRFQFPADTPDLEPGRTVVLATSATAFAERYPDVPLTGIYQGQLSNQGEMITLYDAQGNILDKAAYEDGKGWPLSADGKGDALMRVEEVDGTSAESWGAGSIQLRALSENN
ncbi:MAG: lamin tail domain-containing protein [Chloroflexota bacterium]